VCASTVFGKKKSSFVHLHWKCHWLLWMNSQLSYWDFTNLEKNLTPVLNVTHQYKIMAICTIQSFFIYLHIQNQIKKYSNI